MAFAGEFSVGLSCLLVGVSQWSDVELALQLTIFDAGRLRAGLRGETADLDAAVDSACPPAVQRYQAGLGNNWKVLAAETAVLAPRRPGRRRFRCPVGIGSGGRQWLLRRAGRNATKLIANYDHPVFGS